MPFITSQDVEFKVRKPQVNIVFDLKKFMSDISISEEHTIMSPSQKAVSLMRRAKSCFYVQ